MKIIIGKWIGISLGLGLIPAVLLGASPGGIALTPLILVFCFCVGLVGAAIHSMIFSFRRGNRRQKIGASIFSSLVIVVIALQIRAESTCDFTEEYAIQRISDHAKNYRKLDMQFLGTPSFNEGDCSYSFIYESPSEKYEFMLSRYGKVHTWDFQAHGS